MVSSLDCSVELEPRLIFDYLHPNVVVGSHPYWFAYWIFELKMDYCRLKLGFFVTNFLHAPLLNFKEGGVEQ
jgi:hypothetical protein